MIRDKKKYSIGIIGIGYVGLPLAMEFLKSGFFVVGFEVDRTKIRQINAGRSYIPDVPADLIKSFVQGRMFSATSDFSQLAKMKAIIICVPTPLRKTKDPDISYILSAINKVHKWLKRGQLIILESTTYPGTTREVLLPILTKTGLKVGLDYYLAFSPERLDPGNKKYGVRNTPKIVGGITSECTTRAQELYGHIVNRVVPVSSPETAEMVKLLENTFRAVNVGLVNEVALMCDRMKLDTWEVIDAAATKPFGFTAFYPGPGLGGHCIPLDPHYLSWKLKTLNFYARFIELAGEINSQMPQYVVQKITDGLNKRGKPVKGSKILLLGMAYKKDIGDVRESPALEVLTKLEEREAKLRYHDPYVPSVLLGSKKLRSVPLTSNILKSQDCVVITTNHSCFDMKKVISHAKLIVDTRNATRGVRMEKILKI